MRESSGARRYPARSDDTAHLLSRLAGELGAEADESDAVSRICAQASVVLPAAEHVSVTIRVRRGYRSAGTTGGLAVRADRLQYELDEGPCVEAASDTGEEWFRSGDVGCDPRWPRWGPAVADLGVRSILCVQLLERERPFGAVNMFSEDSGQFVDADDLDRALLWTGHAAAALAAIRQISGLHTAVSARHTIGLAQGIIMDRHGVDEEQAFALLSRLSSHRNEKLRDVARSIVDTREIPTT